MYVMVFARRLAAARQNDRRRRGRPIRLILAAPKSVSPYRKRRRVDFLFHPPPFFFFVPATPGNVCTRVVSYSVISRAVNTQQYGFRRFSLCSRVENSNVSSVTTVYRGT